MNCRFFYIKINCMEKIIEFKNCGFKYRAQSEPTLYDINLTIHKGEKILIAGPSGCGKSTVAHCINGLIPFSYKGDMTGSLKLYGNLRTIKNVSPNVIKGEFGESTDDCGTETRDLSLFDMSMRVGTVLQDSDAQFVGLTVAEDIAFALENDCVGEPLLHDKVLKVAKTVNVEELLKHAPSELSGGQKQRVSMAGILVDDVDLLLFDEPLANLDPATGKRAIELIDEIQKETGAAVVIIEHRLEDVLHRHVDRVLVMNAGRIVSDTTPDELLCSNILNEYGIREPLYITALKYAGVELKPNMKPSSLNRLILSETDINKVKDWHMTNMVNASKPSENVLLKAENIVFSYDNGHKALADVSVNVNEGEMLAIVGTNGAGKSTFSKVICGFEKESEGTITFNGEDLSPLSIKERADRIGYVMQNPNQMISKVMIMEEVALGLKTRGVSDEESAKACEKALKTCGLWKFRNWPVSALSFGQKKRVTIASILALDPKMIILDEPTAGQDYRHYTEIMEFLRELNTKGITVVMITHDMHLMLEYADRAVVFSKGTVIANDTGARILTNPDIIDRASLKETSLYPLAVKCNDEDPASFVQCFIDYERSVRRANNE